jgi:RNA polymerase sigma factor (sigma-70 family)
LLRVDPLRNPEPLIRRVYAYVAYRIGAGPDAEDLTSETFERAVRYRKSYDPGKGDPLPWLIGIARRLIEGRPPTLELAAELPDRPAEGDIADSAVRRLALSSAVSRLDQRDRELIALRYGADLTARQIAQTLDLRTNAVEVALHRALGRLRATLEERGDPPVRKQGTAR